MAIKRGNQRPEMPRNRVLRRLVKFGKGVKVETKNGKQRPANTNRFIPRFGDEDNEHDNDAVLLAALIDVFGDEQPETLSNVYLLDVDYDDDSETETTYQLDYEHWASGLLVKRCDGAHISKQYSRKQNKHVFREDYLETEHADTFDCRNDGSFAVQESGPNKGVLSCGCKFKARLRVVSPELIKAIDSVYGFLEIESGSRADDVSIIASLRYIDEQFAKPRGLRMTQVPLKIYRETMPNYAHGGNKHVIRVSVDYIEYEKLVAERPLVYSAPEPAAAPPSKSTTSRASSWQPMIIEPRAVYAPDVPDNSLDRSRDSGATPNQGFDNLPDSGAASNGLPAFDDVFQKMGAIVWQYLERDLYEFLREADIEDGDIGLAFGSLESANFFLLELAAELGLRFKVEQFFAEQRTTQWSQYVFNIGLTTVSVNSRAEIVAPFVALGGDEATLKERIAKNGLQKIKEALDADCLYIAIKSQVNDDGVRFLVDGIYLNREGDES